MEKAPLVSIGMPVKNGARFLERSIESIRRQTFTDWSVVISDNASTDETGDIGRKYAMLDKRITYIRQTSDIGAQANFVNLVNNAPCQYFMWASDDLWNDEYLRSAVEIMESEREIGMVAFEKLLNIDDEDLVIREYPSFERFSVPEQLEQICRFVTEDEKMGKANLMYSVFRSAVLRKALTRSPFNAAVGSDMGFVLSVLAESKLKVGKGMVFKKRLLVKTKRDREAPGLISPWKSADQYVAFMSAAVKETKYHGTVKAIMELRKKLLEKDLRLQRIDHLKRTFSEPHKIPSKIFRKLSDWKNSL